jgi:hypothetical protein
MAWSAATCPVFSTEALVRAIEASAVGCWEYNKEAGTLTWNSHMYSLFDKDWRSGPVDFARDDAPAVQRALDDSVQSGSYDITCRVVRRDGTQTQIRACCSDGGAESLVGTCVSIAGPAVEVELVEEQRRTSSESTASSGSSRNRNDSSSTDAGPQPVQPGRWRLGPCIARGSFGQVHTALNDVTGELLAVSVNDENEKYTSQLSLSACNADRNV